MNIIHPRKIRWSRTCTKCQGRLYHTSTGNIIDYRHAGGATQCPKPSVVYVEILPNLDPLKELLQSAKKVVVSQ